jgi:PKD repeat protein
MKIKESLGILILILLAFSFALISPTLINQATNVSIKENYSMGETLEGNFTLKLENVNPNALLKTNLGHSISLRDFLKNNSKPFACESFGCGDRYVNSSVGFGSGSIGLPSLKGIRIFGDDVRIPFVSEGGDIQIKANLEFEKANQIPLKITFGDGVIWRFTEESDDFSRKILKGIEDTSEATFNLGIGDNNYCQKFSLVPTKKILLGAEFENPTNDRLFLSLRKSEVETLGECDFVASSNTNCIATLDSEIQAGEYYVCIRSDSSSTNIMLGSKEVSNGGGYYGSLGGSSSIDYSIFAKIPKYSAGESQTELFEEDDKSLILGEIQNYLIKNYRKGTTNLADCSNSCFIPVNFEGISNDLKITNFLLKYSSKVGTPTVTEIYNITKTPITENFNGTIKLEKADFEADFTGSKKLIVTLNETKLFEKNISVISIPMIIRSVFPTTIPAGIPVLFIADVFSASPITSYTWTFGDGTTRTTGSNSVTKAYENITTYNLNLKAINNASQTIEQNFSIITQSPENYLNSSWDRKNNNFNKLSAEIDALSIPFKTQIKAKIGIEGIRTELNSIASARTSATTSQQYLELALRILNLDVPQSIWIEEKTTEPFLTDFNKIDLSIINSLAGTTLTGEQYQRYISNWEMGNVNGTKERISLAILSEEGVKSNLATIYKINVRSNENSHLIIQSGTMESSRTLESAGNGKALSLEKNKQETLDLLSFESVSPAIYVSPSPSGIKIIDPKDIGPCNYNNICEDGEDWRNCRHDCRSWSIIIWFLVGIFIVTIIAYTFVQVQFKKKYELSLFNSKQELHNLVESIRNSQENKIADKEITDKLIKKGWSREQVDYAIKKSKGEKTRPYEIIPVGKIMAQFKGKPNNKNEKHNK